jgi:hypothetical protein
MTFATSVGGLLREKGGLYFLNDVFCLGLAVTCVALTAWITLGLGRTPR